MTRDIALTLTQKPIVEITLDGPESDRPLARLFDDLRSAGLEGREVDVAETLTKAGVKDGKVQKLAHDVYGASRLVRLIEKGVVPKSSYAAVDASLDRQIADAFGKDRNMRTELERDAVELETRVLEAGPKESFERISKKKHGATIDAYDARLKSLASDQPLPPFKTVEREMKAQDEEMVRLGVPKESRQAMQDLMASAYGMRASLDRPEEFATHKAGYEKALNDRTLWKTVSPGELERFRRTLSRLEAMQAGRSVAKTSGADPSLKKQVQKQRQRVSVERRRRPRKKTPRRKTQKKPVMTAEQRQQKIQKYEKQVRMAEYMLRRIRRENPDPRIRTQQVKDALAGWEKSLAHAQAWLRYLKR